MRVLACVTALVCLSVVAGTTCSGVKACFGNGDCEGGVCSCDPGWKGPRCSVLDVRAVIPTAMGYANASDPSWGGGVLAGRAGEPRWTMFLPIKANVSAGASPLFSNNKLMRASASDSPLGPWVLEETVLPRSLRGLPMRAPSGELLLITGDLGGGFIVSESGSVRGPWKTFPSLFNVSQGDRESWHCNGQDFSGIIFPNGTTLVAFRSEYSQCEPQGLEQVGILRAPHWRGPYSLVTPEPLFGPEATNEDPFMWRSKRGVHMLLHSQLQEGNVSHKVRGALAFSPDGIGSWELAPDNAWPDSVTWSNGTTTALLRRQRPALVFDGEPEEGGRAIALVNGADLHCANGSEWGNGISLVVPLGDAW